MRWRVSEITRKMLSGCIRDREKSAGDKSQKIMEEKRTVWKNDSSSTVKSGIEKRMEIREDTDLGDAARVYVWEGATRQLGIIPRTGLKGKRGGVRSRSTAASRTGPISTWVGPPVLRTCRSLPSLSSPCQVTRWASRDGEAWPSPTYQEPMSGEKRMSLEDATC